MKPGQSPVAPVSRWLVTASGFALKDKSYPTREEALREAHRQDRGQRSIGSTIRHGVVLWRGEA